jgi:UDP-N-acetyl-2-amino-2-deoxyglucuronate dehydrogenase
MNVAIIGFGHIGKKHAESISEHSTLRLVAVCDPQFKVSKAVENDILFYQDIDKMLSENAEIDLVVVATPNGFHEANALKVLEYKKHVVIEKPMALTTMSCENIIAKAKMVDKEIFCVMQNRFSPVSQWLKQLIENQTLGRTFMVQINCFWNRDDRYYQPEKAESNKWHGLKSLDGGVLFTQFSHFIDLLYWCFGDIKNVQSKFQNFAHQHSTEFEDSGIVQFDFVNGGIGSINFSTAVSNKNFESSVTIIAEKGTVKVGGQYMEDVIYCEGIEIPVFESMPSNQSQFYNNIIQFFNHQAPKMIPAQDGKAVVAMIEEMMKVTSKEVE